MPKGTSKPHQQIYRPGSGPLRKSNHGNEESDMDTNVIYKQNQIKPNVKIINDGLTPQNIDDVGEITNKLVDMSMKGYDHKKKMRKPEQQLYIPRGIAQAQAKELNENHMQSCDKNIGTHVNGNSNLYGASDRNNPSNRSNKRYSHRRRGGDMTDNHGEWRAKSPGMGRNIRQGSEPRMVQNNMQNNSNWNRMRDTKSVEPNILQTHNANDKIFSKPPSGRRHSTIGLEEKRYKISHFETLPPRLKKKFLEENKLNINQLTNEDVWDGSSVTFQGSHIHHSPKQNLMSKTNYSSNYNTIQEGVPHQAQNTVPSGVYYTLPHRPHRGRGRFQPDYDNRPGAYRSVTPDKVYLSPSNSRPSTPIQMHKTNSNENINRYEPRSHHSSHFRHTNNDKHNQINQNCSVFRNDDRHTKRDSQRDNKSVEDSTPKPFRKSLEEQLSPISPETPKEKETAGTNSLQSTILVSL